MVLAVLPVASLRRFAALPVGAAKETFSPREDKSSIIAFTTVVLPVPGPPVITKTPEEMALSTASFWPGASWMPTVSWACATLSAKSGSL